MTTVEEPLRESNTMRYGEHAPTARNRAKELREDVARNLAVIRRFETLVAFSRSLREARTQETVDRLSQALERAVNAGIMDIESDTELLWEKQARLRGLQEHRGRRRLVAGYGGHWPAGRRAAGAT